MKHNLDFSLFGGSKSQFGKNADRAFFEVESIVVFLFVLAEVHMEVHMSPCIAR